MFIKRIQPWSHPDSAITPESAYLNRRDLLRAGAISAAGLILSGLDRSSFADDKTIPPKKKGSSYYPAKKNKAYRVLEKGKDVTLTKESAATGYNNFYEFSTNKEQVKKLVGKFETDPWKLRIHGLCKKPMTIDFSDILKKMPLEERTYRFRCVEAWAMVVPWTGFPLSKLLALVEPTSKAKFVKFTSFKNEKQAPGFKQYSYYPWPYFEGLRLDEAQHDLTMIATGIYGKPLPKQNGAPLRLIVPWKYGFKSIKSIVDIELVATQPKTFWNSLASDEYGFYANVNPKVPHPRWSQASERMIPDNSVRKTELYNGYADQVAKLYPNKTMKKSPRKSH
ncbi:MAG: protein-methionine-sulfoxide reductase catalytic subunit MsrP [Planctomycetota bacterium]|nr:protein-methionine-sulfoxide reductase catalytic subunit MsrP [Planctomycetota bacterium]